MPSSGKYWDHHTFYQTSQCLCGRIFIPYLVTHRSKSHREK